jgi:hypothetical protein
MRRLKSDQSKQVGHARRGSLTVWSRFAMIVCLCCVSLVVNRSILSNRRAECRQSAQAAALAAARQVLSDNLLRRDLQQCEIDANLAAGRHSAIAMAHLYHARSQTPILADNNIRIGSTVSQPRTRHTIFLQNTTQPNRVEVLLSNQPEDASSRMFLHNVTGVRNANIAAHGVATLENRIKAFQALPENPIPFIPLVLPDGTTTGTWSHDIENHQGADAWSWNSTRNDFEQAADRLPEITLTLQTTASGLKPGECSLIKIAGQQSIIDQIRHGISGPATLTIPLNTAPASISIHEVQDVSSALNSCVGQPRIFALTPVSHDTTSSEHQVQPTRFVAARIVNIQHREGRVGVTLQPCVLSTATAVIAANNSSLPQNRYIWKISLPH